MAETLLRVYGPYEIPWERIDRSNTKKKVTDQHIEQFWEKVRQKSGGTPILEKCGCYVFALRTSRGVYKPYYVGKTANSFQQEVFNDTNKNRYRNILQSNFRGTPYMFFVAQLGNRIAVNRTVLAELERYLIIHAKLRNKDLLNRQSTRLPDWRIRGVIRRRRGRPSVIAQTFKKMMGIE